MAYPAFIGIMYTPKSQAHRVIRGSRYWNLPDFKKDSKSGSMVRVEKESKSASMARVKKDGSMARVDIYFSLGRNHEKKTKKFIKDQLNINANNSKKMMKEELKINANSGKIDLFDYVSIYTSVYELPTVVRALLDPSYRYLFKTTNNYQIMIIKSPLISSFSVNTVYRRMRNLIHNNPSVYIPRRYIRDNNAKLHNKLTWGGKEYNARRIQSVARGMPARKRLGNHRNYKPGGAGYQKALKNFTLHQAASTPIHYRPEGSGYRKALNNFTLHQAAKTPIFTNIYNNDL